MGYTYNLSKNGTEYCILKAASKTQEDNALFYQILSVLQGEKPDYPKDDAVIISLSDIIFYMDFSGIFGTGNSKRQLERQKKAEAMFRPEGITLDFGSGSHRYRCCMSTPSFSRIYAMTALNISSTDSVSSSLIKSPNAL